MPARSACSFSVVLVLAALVPFGCTRVVDRYPGILVQSDDELVFTHRYRVIIIAEAGGGDPQILITSETAIITPRVSPAGDRIAFYDVGTPDLPVSSTRVALVVVPVNKASAVDRTEEMSTIAPKAETCGSLSFDLPQFDLDHRLMIEDAVAPLWEPEGRSLLVAHKRGIERIDLTGERMSVVDGKAVTALALSPDGKRIVYSEGRTIHAVERLHGGQVAVLGENVVPAFGNRRVRALAYSWDGQRLAFGAGNEVFILDVVSKTTRRVFEAPHGVYWLAWLPGDDEIALLYGREDRRRGLHSTWTTGKHGRYTLAVIGEEGRLRRQLYSAHLIDVRHATPALSPDGRYVSVTVRDGATKEIVVVATDGSGALLVTSSGSNAYASWRPAR